MEQQNPNLVMRKDYLELYADKLESVLKRYRSKDPGYFGLSIPFLPDGFESGDLSFLKEFKGLTHLSCRCDLKNASALMECSSIQELNIDHVKTELDLSRFPNLHTFVSDWSKNIKNISKSKSIELLVLRGYKPLSKDLCEFSEMKNLKSLELVQGNITSLNGIQKLKELTYLGCYYQRNLSDLTALSDGESPIKTLDFESCKKIENLDEVVTKMPLLELLKLYKCGEFENISFVKAMPTLNRIVILETNIIDGDLNPIIDNQKINSAALDNKKHYSPKASEVDLILADRNSK